MLGFIISHHQHFSIHEQRLQPAAIDSSWPFAAFLCAERKQAARCSGRIRSENATQWGRMIKGDYLVSSPGLPPSSSSISSSLLPVVSHPGASFQGQEATCPPDKWYVFFLFPFYFDSLQLRALIHPPVYGGKASDFCIEKKSSIQTSSLKMQMQHFRRNKIIRFWKKRTVPGWDSDETWKQRRWGVHLNERGENGGRSEHLWWRWWRLGKKAERGKLQKVSADPYHS